MQKNIENIEIVADKALVEKMFSKANLEAFDANNSQVPDGYFEQFETRLLLEIHSASPIGQSTTKPTSRIFAIPKWGQLAIAASFFTIIATTYLFIQNDERQQDVPARIKLQDIASSEMESYIKENEEMAEIDWQNEINKEARNLAALNEHLVKDTNTSQQ